MDRLIGTYTVDNRMLEYSIPGKAGEPVLVLHGGHSSCYEEFGYDFLLKNNFKSITTSRAGSGEISTEIGESLSLACHYYVDLLN